MNLQTATTLQNPQLFDVDKVVGKEGDALFDVPGSFCDDPLFKIYLFPVRTLMTHDRIPRHEEILPFLQCSSARDLKNSAMVLKTIFVSHRWINGKPDSDDNAQWTYIKGALRKIANFEECYLWIDYACMKQDTPDIETIKRLNFILSFCGIFMLVLPDFDPKGFGYVQRVWCIYEWLSAIHFLKTIIVASRDIVVDLMKHTKEIFTQILDARVLRYLEEVRVSCESQLPLMIHVMRSCIIEDMISADAFVSLLQAFREEDKLFVFENISRLFTPLDVLFLMVVGSGRISVQILAVAELEDFQIQIFGLSADMKKSGSDSSLSSLGLPPDWDKDSESDEGIETSSIHDLPAPPNFSISLPLPPPSSGDFASAWAAATAAAGESVLRGEEGNR